MNQPFGIFLLQYITVFTEVRKQVSPGLDSYGLVKVSENVAGNGPNVSPQIQGYSSGGTINKRAESYPLRPLILFAPKMGIFRGEGQSWPIGTMQHYGLVSLLACHPASQAFHSGVSGL